MKFKTQEFKDFRNAMAKAVKGVEAEFGVVISFGNISYADVTFNMKTEVTLKSKDGKSSEQLLFEQDAKFVGLKAEHYGTEFKHPQYGVCKLVAVRKRARKRPYVIQQQDGTMYVLSQDRLKALTKIEAWA